MRKIIISSGHGGIDSGAVAQGYKEADLAIELRDLIVKELNLLGAKAVIDKNSNALKESIAFFKTLLTGKDIAFDIHWNAATPQATGTETFIPNDATDFEKRLAREIADDVSTILNIPNRGVKTEAQSARKTLGWMRMTAEEVLLETCFITSTKDMESYQKNKNLLAKTLAKTLFEFSNL